MTSAYDHGRHWYFLAADGEAQQTLQSIFAKLAGEAALTVEHQKHFQLIDAEGDLRCSFLLRNEEFVAGYPMVVDGFGWPLKIHDTVTWPDQVQSSLVASCEGQRITLFDTQHFLHKHTYTDESEHMFVVGAIAYKLFDTMYDSPEQEAELRQTKAYFPLREEDGGTIDEIKFMSHVEAVREIDFHGIPMRAYTVTLAEPEEFPMRIDVFAHPSVCERDFAPGDAISGFAWEFETARAE